MTNVSSNNPAGRLLRLVKESRGRDLHAASARQVWSTILGCNSRPVPVLLTTLGHALRLPYEVHEAVTAAGLGHWLITWTERVMKRWDEITLVVEWKHYIDPFSEDVVGLLTGCDHELARVSSERVTEIDALIALRDEVRSLISEVVNAKIEEPLRQYLLRMLLVIEQSILDFFLRGDVAINQAVETLRGVATCRRGIVESIEPHLDTSIRITAKVHRLVGMLVHTALVMYSAYKLLGGDPIEPIELPPLPELPALSEGEADEEK